MDYVGVGVRELCAFVMFHIKERWMAGKIQNEEREDNTVLASQYWRYFHSMTGSALVVQSLMDETLWT